MPKIGYLIDENAGWDDDPSWQFYTESGAPELWQLARANKKDVKRIVYWEIDDE